jgi:hypothetical protein
MMGKSISGEAIYEIKVTNPNSIANFDAGKLTKAIGEDFNTFMGKPTQGLVVKASDAMKVIDKVKKDMVAKKVNQPWIRAGLSGSDVIFLVTDLKGKYEQSCTLVPGYVELRKKLKEREGMVVNLQKGDGVIDRASDKMAKVQKTTAVEGKDAEFGKITGSTPIVLVAHGRENKESPGKFYGEKFARKSPQELVNMLTENTDPNKCLAKDYSGVIYLDGCFTAEQGGMNNYCATVWSLLKAKGYKNAKVKGNLGAAATTVEGDEIVSTTEAKAAVQKLKDQADKDNEALWSQLSKPLIPIWTSKYKAKNDKAGFDKEPAVIKARADYELARKAREKKLEQDIAKVPGFKVKNFVGQFGLERLG